MPRGDKGKYNAKQKRQAEHTEESYVDRSVERDEAESRAWATVNKQDGGGKRGWARTPGKKSAKKGGRKKSGD